MMSFFQDVMDNPLLQAELFIILLFIALQVYFFVKTKLSAKVLEDIFIKPLRLIKEGKSSDSLNNVILLKSESKNKVNQRIKESINNYLSHNRGGTVNYSIIKDIIEREIDSKESEIVQAIPIPLYLGLSATIVGIIFGLFAMPDLAQEANSGATSGVGDLAGIDALINGVKIAMVATLSGLVWTILLSTMVYSKASKKILKDKNSQLNYLQENLLPELFKAEDAGVVGLKSSIDNFSRLTTNIVEEIREATQTSKENIVSQQETLDRIEKLNVTKISKVNLELFDRLERNMDSFYEFSEFIGQLSAISEGLDRFSRKAGSIDKIAEHVDQTLEESRNLTKFLTSHLQKMEEMGDVALYSFDLSEKRFKEAVDKLVETTADNVNSVKTVSDEIENSFDKVYDQLFIKLEEIAKLHIDQFTEVYNDSLPKFQNLDHLKELEEIKSQLSVAFNGRANGTEGIGKTNNLELVTIRLNQITGLLTELEKNTKALKGYTRRVYLPKWLRDFFEWFKSFFKK